MHEIRIKAKRGKVLRSEAPSRRVPRSSGATVGSDRPVRSNLPPG